MLSRRPGLPADWAGRIDNNRLYVLDGGLSPVPAGVVGGQLWRRHGVGRGYFNDPSRSAAVFLPNPFAQQPGERLYRTGDGVAASTANWNTWAVSTSKSKCGGFRIELGEIESRLRDLDGVREAAVSRTARPRKRLVVFIVTDDDVFG